MDSPSCVMLKHEDWPGLEKISALRGFQKKVAEVQSQIAVRINQSDAAAGMDVLNQDIRSNELFPVPVLPIA